MGLILSVWEKLFVTGRYKRKQYEKNAVYHQDRSVKTLCSMVLSQLKADFDAKISLKSNDIFGGGLRYPVKQIYNLIDECEIVSFDVFDTMIFRPVARPTDIFGFLELDNHIFDFKRLRIQAEILARKYTNKPNAEINLRDIYTQFDKLHSCSIDQMVKAEEEIEKKLAFANPFILEIYKYAKLKNKKIIAVSDMYISSDVIKSILESNQYYVDDIFVSCDIGCNKRDSALQKYVSDKMGSRKVVHIGDSLKNDIKASEKVGWKTFHIQNINILGHKKRAFIDDTFEGSLYAGIINSALYSGCFGKKSPQYMYGYLYGGLLTLGFCQWLKEIKRSTNAEHIIFLGRDCKVIKEIYDRMYNSNEDSYMEISRMAILPILADVAYDNFLLEAFERRINSGKTISEAFESVGIKVDINVLFEGKMGADDLLNRSMYGRFKQLMYEKRDDIVLAYKEKYSILKEFLDSYFKDKEKVIVVDLGWRGSTILYLRDYLKKKAYDIEVVGAMMGMADTESSYVSSSSKDMNNYLFSPLDKKRACVKNKEICYDNSRFMFEYMYTSTDNSVIGYVKSDDIIIPVREKKNTSKNIRYIKSVHKGIIDFVQRYKKLTGEYASRLFIDQSLVNELIGHCLEKNSIEELFSGFEESADTTHGY